MLRITEGGPLMAKLRDEDDTVSPFDTPSSFTDVSDIWSLSNNEQVRSEIRLLYPQDVMPEPVSTGAPGNLDAPQENGNGNTTLAQAATGNQIIDGLFSGIKWDPAQTIYYSDTDSAADYQAGYNSDADGDSISAQNEGFSQFTAQQTLAFHTALNSTAITQSNAATAFGVESFTNLGLSYDGAGSAIATIRGANSSDPGTAYAYYPSNSIYGGDTFFGNGYDGTVNSLKTPTAGNYAWHTMFHELGHSLGLAHGQTGGAYGALPTAWDSIEFTVMTYRSYIGDPLTGGYSYEQWGAPQSYMMLDILALQTMYGADYSVNSGNTVYTWSQTGGETLINGSVAIDPGGNRIFATIWDGGGIDTYNLSNYTTNLTLDLNPGGHSTFSSAQIAYLGDGNYARGNIFNALLFGGNTASLIENANGGSGNDTITGNQADNVLNGNGGNDVINGGSGSDTIRGGNGNDALNGGGGGNDQVYGDAGNDTLYWGPPSPSISDVRIHDGGTGIDTIHGGGTVFGSVTFDLNAGTYSNGGSFNESWVNFENYYNDANGSEIIIGTTGANVITTGAGANIINSGGGNDTISSGDGNDTVDGGTGNDLINAGGGADTVNGGDGNDTIDGGSEDDLLIGGGGNDVIAGGSGNDQLRGGAGNDIFDGGSGVDIFYGEEGSDTLRIFNGWNGGYGEIFLGGANVDIFDFSGTVGLNANVNLTNGEFEDALFPGYGIALSSVEYVIAGNGNDIITGSAEVNRLEGRGGNDELFGLVGNDALLGGDGNDLLDGGEGIDNMTGGNGDDIYYVDAAGDNVIENALAGGTNDAIFSSVSYSLSGRYIETMTLTGVSNINATGNDFAQTLNGNDGNNTLIGLGGNDVLNGGDGNDLLDGGADNDVMNGGAGNDTVRYLDAAAGVTVNLGVAGVQVTGGSGSDTLSGIENLSGSAFNDVITGNAGANILKGGAGNDQFVGGAGTDTVDGGSGNDIINGGGDNDILIGGTGNDIFAFMNGLAGNLDTITDYSVADDQFRLSSAAFGGLPVGTLTAAAFRIGAAAADASDRIIYNSATGALLFDADGNGAGAAVQFASISTGLAMTNAEFVIV